MKATRILCMCCAVALSWAGGCRHATGQSGGAPDAGTDTDADTDSDSDGDSDGDTDTESSTAPCDKGVWYGDFVVHGEEAESIDHLSGFTDVSGNFYISENDTLEDLQGLECLTGIWGNFAIDHTALVSLSGLESLERIDYDITISNNGALASLEALDGLLHCAGSGYCGHAFHVHGNPALPNCEATELRDQLDLDEEEASICIEGNLPDGCPDDIDTCNY